MKTVHLQYFALLRDQRGLSREDHQTNARTTEELYRELSSTHGFTLSMDHLKVAVNDEFSAWSTLLNEGDRVVFIPPVAGG